MYNVSVSTEPYWLDFARLYRSTLGLGLSMQSFWHFRTIRKSIQVPAWRRSNLYCLIRRSQLPWGPIRHMKNLRIPATQLENFDGAIQNLSLLASINLRKAQLTYKKDYYFRVRPVDQPTVNDWVFIRREKSDEDFEGQKRRKKLQKNLTGPFWVIRANERNVVVKIGDDVENVDWQRVVKAPGTISVSLKHPDSLNTFSEIKIEETFWTMISSRRTKKTKRNELLTESYEDLWESCGGRRKLTIRE